MSESKKVYVLYDGRARYGVDTDACAVLCSAHSEREAWADSKTSFRGMCGLWFEYDLVEFPPTKDNPYGREARNERARPDIGKGFLLEA